MHDKQISTVMNQDFPSHFFEKIKIISNFNENVFLHMFFSRFYQSASARSKINVLTMMNY